MFRFNEGIDLSNMSHTCLDLIKEFDLSNMFRFNEGIDLSNMSHICLDLMKELTFLICYIYV